MQRTYLTLWKQYLTEQETGQPPMDSTDPSNASTKDAHYYEPGEEEPHDGPDFTMKFPDFPYGMQFYDVMGKKSQEWRSGIYAKAAANVMKPRVQTTWFAVYPIGGPWNGRYNIFGYHPETGKITDARGGSVMFSPGKNMSDAAVYQWMFDKFDKPNDVLVGTISRKQSYGG